MAIDFRASQVQTNKLIASPDIGGTITNAKLLIYPLSSEDSAIPNEGYIDQSIFNTSNIGTEVFMYVSGAIGGKVRNQPNTISVFGGDLFVSGNIIGGENSSITQLVAINPATPRNRGAGIFSGLNNAIESKFSSVPAVDGPNTILGGAYNSIITLGTGSVIAGGISNLISHSSTAHNMEFGGANSIVGGQFNNILGFGSAGGSYVYSFIGGGLTNRISQSNASIIVGGTQNLIGYNTTVNTFMPTQPNGLHFIGGGRGNSILVNGTGSVVVGGVNNLVSASGTGGTLAVNAFIGGGSGNKILDRTGTANSTRNSFIGGGGTNLIAQNIFSTIAGGELNAIETTAVGAVANSGRHFIGGGSSNNITVNGSGSVITGGTLNSISSSSATIIGPSTCTDSFIGGGRLNSIIGSSAGTFRNVIGGGSSNVINNSTNSSILGGQNNSIITSTDTTIIGSSKSITSATQGIFLAGGVHVNCAAARGHTAGVLTVGVEEFFIPLGGATPAAVTISTTGIKEGRMILIRNVSGNTLTINSFALLANRVAFFIFDGSNWFTVNEN